MVSAHLLETSVNCKADEDAAWPLLLIKIIGHWFRRLLNHN